MASPGRDTSKRAGRLLPVALAALAALAVVAVVGARRFGASAPAMAGDDVALDALFARLADRGIEPRLAELPADRRLPLRAGGADPASSSLLSTLAASRDARRAALGLLLQGNGREAASRLEALGDSEEGLIDRAAAALVDHQPSAAIALLGRLPEAAQQRPAASWNRALALRDLGLPTAAADAFASVGAASEAGWVDEARARERELRAVVSSRYQRWSTAKTALEAMVAGGPPVDAAVARAFPGSTRLYFNDALRGAGDAARIQSLAPLAAALDAHYGGTVLGDAVRRASGSDLSRRRPLADAYRKLTAREQLGMAIPPGDLDVPALEAGARAASMDDLLLGTWVLTDAVPEHQAEFDRRARALADPWLVLHGLQLEGASRMERGQLVEAERPLTEGQRACRQHDLGYRCAYFEFHLAWLEMRLLRPVEGQRLAGDGLRRAQAMEEWGLEAMFLQELASAARHLGEGPLARAYLAELRARARDFTAPGKWRRFCGVEQNAIHQLAYIALDELRPAVAYDLLRAAPLCDAPLDVSAAEAWSRLPRWNTGWVDERWLLSQLEARRAMERANGLRALADVAAGRMLAWRDMAPAMPLLRRAIETAERGAAWDLHARMARARAYEALAFAEARRGAWVKALEVLAEEAGVPPSGECRLGVALDGTELLVAWQGPGGAAGGRDVRADAENLPPIHFMDEEALSALRQCPIVDVLARPPFQGSSELLPPEVAWRFRMGRPRIPLPTPRQAGPRLVVSVTQPKPELGLPTLAPLPPPGSEAGERVLLLEGDEATPARVLAEMLDASEIEFHAHGLVDLDVSDASFLVLAPGGDGAYALTAGQLRQQHLRNAPLVLLQSCHAAHPAPDRFAPWSLPVAFMQAGARAVLASLTPVVDADARPFFDTIGRLVRKGTQVATALRDARLAAVKANPTTTVRHVVLFE